MDDSCGIFLLELIVGYILGLITYVILDVFGVWEQIRAVRWRSRQRRRRRG